MPDATRNSLTSTKRPTRLSARRASRRVPRYYPVDNVKQTSKNAVPSCVLFGVPVEDVPTLAVLGPHRACPLGDVPLMVREGGA